MKKISMAVVLFLISGSLFAFDIGGVKIKTTPDSSSGSGKGTASAGGRDPSEVADEFVDYIRKKWPVDGDRFKSNLAQSISYVKAKYGAPDEQNNIYADWYISAGGSNCAKMRLSDDGHAMNITRSVGPCSMLH